MKIVIDCEFTQLNATSKLISMALVAEDAQELYFELTDNYGFPDCSDFVLEHVLPQLDGGHVACTIHEAQVKLQAFLKKFELVQIMSDAPLWDWEFFCEIAYFNNKWPGNVLNRPINLIDLYNEKDIQVESAPELPHHALLDARLLMSYYKKYLRE
jgi:hypothetical protein